ncbi:MAG: hypothetical protein II348_05330 [Clostridia bacterium]|nr:hypothetical protein [Clostridia bacterium]
MERISSPEQLNDYIHISNPSAWIVLAAFTILLIGICIWGIFGRLDTTLSVAAVKADDRVVCCVKEADYEKVRVGMTVEIGEEAFSVTEIGKTPVPVDDSIPEYAKHVGSLTEGEWIYYIYTDCPPGPEGNVVPAKIIVERVHPFYFVTN